MTSIEPLYVDTKAAERSVVVLRHLLEIDALSYSMHNAVEALLAEKPEGGDYRGDGTMLAPFLTVDDARKVQKPGQPIIIAGYATIGAASGA